MIKAELRIIICQDLQWLEYLGLGVSPVFIKLVGRVILVFLSRLLLVVAPRSSTHDDGGLTWPTPLQSLEISACVVWMARESTADTNAEIVFTSLLKLHNQWGKFIWYKTRIKISKNDLVIFLFSFVWVNVFKILVILQNLSGEVKDRPGDNLLLDGKPHVKVNGKRSSILVRHFLCWVVRNSWRLEKVEERIDFNFFGDGLVCGFGAWI